MLAGTWEPVPDDNTPTGYKANYHASAVHEARKTAGPLNNDQTPVYGAPWNSNGSTYVKMRWKADTPFEIAPANVSGTFLWTFSGDVSEVSEQAGHASARLDVEPIGSRYYLFEKTLNSGATATSIPVPNPVTPQSEELYSMSVPWWEDNPVVEVSFGSGLHSNVQAYYDTDPWLNGHARAVSAAATVGIVTNSIQLSP